MLAHPLRHKLLSFPKSAPLARQAVIFLLLLTTTVGSSCLASPKTMAARADRCQLTQEVIHEITYENPAVKQSQLIHLFRVYERTCQIPYDVVEVVTSRIPGQRWFEPVIVWLTQDRRNHILAAHANEFPGFSKKRVISFIMDTIRTQKTIYRDGRYYPGRASVVYDYHVKVNRKPEILVVVLDTYLIGRIKTAYIYEEAC